MAEKTKSDVREAAETLGHRGGLKGGPARARRLTERELKEIARRGGLAKARKTKKK